MAEEAITAALQPDGNITAAIQQAVADAVAPGGSIHVAIQNSLNSAIGEGGSIHGAVQNSFNSAIGEGGSIHGAVAAAIKEAALPAKAEAAYPCLKHLQGLTVEEYRAAWRALLVDSENSEHVLNSFSDQGVASVFGLAAAYTGNAELQRMKQAAIMKSAPKTSLKALCLAAKGGGPDKIQVYLSEKAESGPDDVKALARALLMLFYMIEKRYTVLQATKKTAPTKAAAQRDEMMPFFYHTVKAYKKRTTKATAFSNNDTAALLAYHGTDMLVALTTMQASDRKRPAAPSAQSSPLLTSATAASAQASQAAAAAANAAKKPKNGDLKKELQTLVQKNPGDTGAIDAFIKAKSAGPEKQVMLELLKNVCKNCLLAGRGMHEHTLKSCRDAGNPCALPCPKCKKAGREEFHWLQSCPAA